MTWVTLFHLSENFDPGLTDFGKICVVVTVTVPVAILELQVSLYVVVFVVVLVAAGPASAWEENTPMPANVPLPTNATDTATLRRLSFLE
jgi:hypothetical protein